MKYNYDSLPDEIKRDGLFCLWKYEVGSDGRMTKVPYNPKHPKRRVDSTDRSAFSDFQTAVKSYMESDEFDGIGLGVFDGKSGVDIDDCYYDGEPSATAGEVMTTIKSYAEVSPSGEGIRILCKTHRDFKYDKETFYTNNKAKGLEIYVAGSTNKFLTLTGNRLNQYDLEECTFEVLKVADKFMRRPPSGSGEAGKTTIPDNDTVIKKAANAKNGEKFMKLWSGDSSGYPSDSEADLALCEILAFWCNRDPDQIDKLFRQSGLYRPKWDERRGGQTYGQMTVMSAVKKCQNVYGERKKTLEPSDYSDLGQAVVLFREYGHLLRYSKATGFLVFTGKRWEEDDLKAQRFSQELTDRQLQEARERIDAARKVLDDAIEGQKDTKEAALQLAKEEKFREFVIKRRSSKLIKAATTEAAPLAQIDVKMLDADGYLLNTPSGTVDLRTGELRQHNAEDYITKITEVAPDDKGADVWLEFLDRLTCEDKELQAYLQEIAGICSIGCVKREELVIAVGSGGNGKSTFFNCLFRVLGDYSGMLSAETLTKDSRKNKSPEYAELRGKRLIIAAELEENARLDTSTVKKLCSTDPILGERKYKDPFTFIPSHHCILYSNHLPYVGTNDRGTWDRLVVIPFNARFRGMADEIKDYTGYLLDHCGGAVLSWIIEGAKRVIDNHFTITQPAAVRDAISQYKEDNDWLAAFIEEKCVVGRYCSAAAPLYAEYKIFCEEFGEHLRSSKDFYHALEGAGYIKRTKTKGKFYEGLRVKTCQEKMAV